MARRLRFGIRQQGETKQEAYRSALLIAAIILVVLGLLAYDLYLVLDLHW